MMLTLPELIIRTFALTSCFLSLRLRHESTMDQPNYTSRSQDLQMHTHTGTHSFSYLSEYI